MPTYLKYLNKSLPLVKLFLLLPQNGKLKCQVNQYNIDSLICDFYWRINRNTEYKIFRSKRFFPVDQSTPPEHLKESGIAVLRCWSVFNDSAWYDNGQIIDMKPNLWLPVLLTWALDIILIADGEKERKQPGSACVGLPCQDLLNALCDIKQSGLLCGVIIIISLILGKRYLTNYTKGMDKSEELTPENEVSIHYMYYNCHYTIVYETLKKKTHQAHIVLGK